MATEKKFTWNYQTLSDLTGLKVNTIQQHVARKTFNPERLRDVLLWVARHGKPELKREIFDYMTQRELPKRAEQRNGDSKRSASGTASQ